MHRGFITVLIVALIAAAAAAAAAYFTLHRGAASEALTGQAATTTATTGRAAPSNLQTYANAGFGFSIEYPSSLTVNPPCVENQGPESCAQKNLITFYGAAADPSDGFAYGYVLVPTPSAIPNCASDPGIGIGRYSTATIGGVTFGVYSTGSAAAGTQETETSYSTEHNGLCYTIAVDEYGHYTTGREGGDPVQSALESIPQSFRFTAPFAASVPGMSEYTDADFGFSFWYPSGWTVSDTDPWVATSGGTVVKTLGVGPGNPEVKVEEVSSPAMYITDTGAAGPLGPVTYSFDPVKREWTVQSPKGPPEATSLMSTATLTSFTNTMGGLHLLPGTSRFDTSIIPLSATRFVIVSDGGAANAHLLAQTVVATDPAVATPVSAADQEAAIEAEAAAYAAQ